MKGFNINDLLVPINEGAKGINIRENLPASTYYYAIKDARQKARSKEIKFLQKESDDNGLNSWSDVKNQAIDLLTNQSKDLEVLAWLLEALLRTDGYMGLAKGFNVAIEFIQLFWDDLYPEEDEDGLETKVASFIGLNGHDSPGSLVQPIKSVAITEGNSVGPFALWQYQQALEIEKIGDPQKQEQRIRNIGFSLSDIQCAVTESSAKFYMELLQQVEQCQERFDFLDTLFIKKCGQEAPPSTYIRTALSEVREYINFLLQDTVFYNEVFSDAMNENAFPEKVAESMKASTHQISNKNSGKALVNNRSEALDILTRVANYFSEKEPHSPIPFVLNRAVRWGSMSLPELLKELIVEDTAKENIGKLTGINLNEE